MICMFGIAKSRAGRVGWRLLEPLHLRGVYLPSSRFSSVCFLQCTVFFCLRVFFCHSIILSFHYFLYSGFLHLQNESQCSGPRRPDGHFWGPKRDGPQRGGPHLNHRCTTDMVRRYLHPRAGMHLKWASSLSFHVINLPPRHNIRAHTPCLSIAMIFKNLRADAATFCLDLNKGNVPVFVR